MDSRRSRRIFLFCAALLSFALLFLVARGVFVRFFLPEAASVSVTVLEASRFEPVEILLAQPTLVALIAWLSPFRSFGALWPSVCAGAGLLLAIALLYPLRASSHPFFSLLFFVPAVLSAPFLFMLTADPASAIAVACLSVAVADMLSHLRTGRTFPLFSAGLALGLVPFAASWGLYAVLGAVIVNRLLIEAEEHGFFAEYIVLFTPFLLIGGGWWFLHWVYRTGGSLFMPLSLPLPEASLFPLTSFVLLIGAAVTLCAIRCGKDREDCAITFRFFLLCFTYLGIVWLLLPAAETRLRLALLSAGILLIFLAASLLPFRRRMAPFIMLLLLCVVTWRELPVYSQNLGRWSDALRGEGAISGLYPSEESIGRYLHDRLSGIEVGLDGRAPVVEFFAGGRVRFVPPYEQPLPEVVLRPSFTPLSGGDNVLLRGERWTLLQRAR